MLPPAVLLVPQFLVAQALGQVLIQLALDLGIDRCGATRLLAGGLLLFVLGLLLFRGLIDLLFVDQAGLQQFVLQ